MRSLEVRDEENMKSASSVLLHVNQKSKGLQTLRSRTALGSTFKVIVYCNLSEDYVRKTVLVD